MKLPGLASSGAWCCFDEFDPQISIVQAPPAVSAYSFLLRFNRIDLEVLSVIAQQALQPWGMAMSKHEQFDAGRLPPLVKR